MWGNGHEMNGSSRWVRPCEHSRRGSMVCGSWAGSMTLSGLGLPCRWECNFLYFLTAANADKRTCVPPWEPWMALFTAVTGGRVGNTSVQPRVRSSSWQTRSFFLCSCVWAKRQLPRRRGWNGDPCLEVLQVLEVLLGLWRTGSGGGPARGQKDGPNHRKPSVCWAGDFAVLGEGRQEKT